MIDPIIRSNSTMLLIFLVVLVQQVLLISSLEARIVQPTDSQEMKNETLEDNRSVVEAYPSWVLLCTQIMPTVLFIDRYITLISYILGFPGNLISLLVWTSRCMYRGNSAAIYLAALSINDLIVLFMALIRDLSRVWDVREFVFPGYCEIKMTTTPAVQYSSPLFVLGFTVERWLAICRPFAIDRICSARRAIYICILIITGTTIICSGNAYIFVTAGNYCDKRDAHSEAANAYLYVLEGVFSGIVPFLVLIFNCMVIRELARIHQANKRLAVLSNRLINTDQPLKPQKPTCFGEYCQPCMKIDFGLASSCCKFYRNRDKNPQPVYAYSFSTDKTDNPINGTLDNAPRNSSRHLLSGRSSRSRTGESCNPRPRGSGLSDETKSSYNTGHNPSFRSTTIMLLVVSFYMIITTMLGGLVYAVHQGSEVPSLNLTKKQALEDPVWINYMKIMLFKTIGDEIALSHYAMGFIIYYATGRNFRQRVHQLLGKLCLKLGFHCGFATKFGMSEDYDLSSTRRRTQKRLIVNDEFLTDPGRHSDYRNSMVNDTQCPIPDNPKRQNGNSLNVPTHRIPRRPKTDLLRLNSNTFTNSDLTKNDIINNSDSNSQTNDAPIHHPLSKVSVDSTAPFLSNL